MRIPKFKNEKEEADFWARLNLDDYFSKKDFEKVTFVNLKPTSRLISIRLPEYLLNLVKEKANEIGVSYQSLIKQYIKKGLIRD